MIISLTIRLSKGIEYDLSSLRSGFIASPEMEFSLPVTEICPRHHHIVPIHNLGRLDNRNSLAELDLALSRLHWNSFPLVLQNVLIKPPLPCRPYAEFFAKIQKSDRLGQIHKRLGTLLRQAGLPVSPKRYRPDVLLARSDYATSEQIRLWAQQNNLFRSRPMQVDTFSLLEHFGHYNTRPYRILASYNSMDASSHVQED